MASSTYYHGSDPNLFESGGNASSANRTLGNTDNFALGFVRNGVTVMELGDDQITTFSHGLMANDKDAAVASTLAEALDNSETEIDITSATGFATAGTVIVDSEQITYTGITTNTLTGCTRGANSTSNVTHTNSTAIGMYITLSGSLNYFSAGPITIPVGAVIDLPAGGTWTIA